MRTLNFVLISVTVALLLSSCGPAKLQNQVSDLREQEQVLKEQVDDYKRTIINLTEKNGKLFCEAARWETIAEELSTEWDRQAAEIEILKGQVKNYNRVLRKISKLIPKKLK